MNKYKLIEISNKFVEKNKIPLKSPNYAEE